MSTTPTGDLHPRLFQGGGETSWTESRVVSEHPQHPGAGQQLGRQICPQRSPSKDGAMWEDLGHYPLLWAGLRPPTTSVGRSPHPQVLRM